MILHQFQFQWLPMTVLYRVGSSFFFFFFSVVYVERVNSLNS
ncbi:UPF0260 protein YcgN [Bienertia sinuspersici]